MKQQTTRRLLPGNIVSLVGKSGNNPARVSVERMREVAAWNAEVERKRAAKGK